MNAAQFKIAVEKLSFGKRLPTALYVARPVDGDLIGAELWATIRRAETAARPEPAWNLLKLHLDQFALTFLSYPDFDADPHPALAEATKINLNTGSVVRTDYRQRANPPILHRKETFLAPDDPRVTTFSNLTAQEEAAGLYRDPSRIGLRLHWHSLLKKLGLTYEGHALVSLRAPSPDEPELTDAPKPEVARHRTAIKRYDLSKPVKLLLERGLLRKQDTFFDFGCGHGMDIEALQSLGYTASGWDPAFRPTAPKARASVVNLGYVLNVIEDPRERVAALREAFGLAERLLLVSTMAIGQETASHTRAYGDGFLTKTNTFQKFFLPGELESLIEENLEAEAVTLGLGLCLVFRNPDEAELFESSRNRRAIDWTDLSVQLKFSAPQSRERRNVDRYELHRELLDAFWQHLLDLGRLPEPGEFDRLAEVKKAAGGLNRAFRLVVDHHGDTAWNAARKARSEDTLVYLAMTNFRKRLRRREIPTGVKHDIRAFFGDLQSAQAKAKDLLFAAGDPDEIELACEGLDLGWQGRDALIVHRSLFDQLPPILRIYVLCAAHRYGDPTQADLIKIHKRSGKVTFQHYDDFDGKPLPELKTRIKVNLRNLFVEVFDHSIGPKIQLLYFKERFVGRADPNREAMEKFSGKLMSLGLDEDAIGYGLDKGAFLRFLDTIGSSGSASEIEANALRRLF